MQRLVPFVEALITMFGYYMDKSLDICTIYLASLCSYPIMGLVIAFLLFRVLFQAIFDRSSGVTTYRHAFLTVTDTLFVYNGIYGLANGPDAAYQPSDDKTAALEKSLGEQHTRTIVADLEVWETILNSIPLLIIQLGMFLYFNEKPSGITGISLFLLATLACGFFAGHSLAVQFRLIYYHHNPVQSILTEIFFVVDVVAQGFAISMLGFNLGARINSMDKADIGLVAGIVVIIAIYFAGTFIIRMLLRICCNTWFETHSYLQDVCSTWCSLAIYNCRFSSLLAFIQNTLFQIIVAASYLHYTGKKPITPVHPVKWTFSDTFCVVIFILNFFRLALYWFWIVPIMYPNNCLFRTWSRIFGKQIVVAPRRKAYRLGFIWTLLSFVAAGLIGFALIFGAPSSSGKTVCRNLPTSQVFPLLYIESASALTLTANCHTTNLKDVTTIDGALFIQNLTFPHPSLQFSSVNGPVNILGNYITTLQLNALTSVQGNVQIANNIALVTVSFGIMTSAMNMAIVNNAALQQVYVPVLSALMGGLQVSSNAALSTFSMPFLQRVSHAITITNNAALTSVSLPLLSIVVGVDFQICHNKLGLTVPANILTVSAAQGNQCNLQNGNAPCTGLVAC